MCRTSATSQMSIRSTPFPSTPYMAPLVPLAATALFTSGTKTPSIVSRDIRKSVVPFLQQPSTTPEPFSHTPSVMIGARAMHITRRSTRTKSCCTPSSQTNANRDPTARRGRRPRWLMDRGITHEGMAKNISSIESAAHGVCGTGLAFRSGSSGELHHTRAS